MVDTIITCQKGTRLDTTIRPLEPSVESDNTVPLKTVQRKFFPGSQRSAFKHLGPSNSYRGRQILDFYARQGVVTL